MIKEVNNKIIVPLSKQKAVKVRAGFFSTIKNWMDQLVHPQNAEDSVREAIEGLIEDGSDDPTALVTEERTLLSNILRLRDRTVLDVMVPRADISALDIKASFSDLIELINSKAHSRIPVYQKTLDNAIGMIHIKDVMAASFVSRISLGENQKNKSEKLHLRDIMRDVLFVVPSMQVLELLLEMRIKRIHMALVVDEFGGVDGLLTIEDLVEEIVGEIEDEHDQEDNLHLILKADDVIEVDARILIEVFEDKVGMVFTDEEREEFDTLGGLVFSLAGSVPFRGELVPHSSGMQIEIVDVDPRRIKKIRIRGLKTTSLSLKKDKTKETSAVIPVAP